MSIYDNVQSVLEKAARAAERSGRRPDEVLVIGVTKTVGVDKVWEMVRAGITTAGENRVQELLAKKEQMPDLPFHMIGHLQSNKVKQAVAAADMIHSVDSLRIAELVDKYAAESGKKMDILVQINVGDEDTKFGIPANQAFEFVSSIAQFRHISVRGLMCIAPFVENQEKNRPHFQKMFQIYVDIKHKIAHNKHKLDTLSMGMTLDYEVAIEEGATMVRIGTAIFGERS